MGSIFEGGEKSQHTLARGKADCLNRILAEECDDFPAGFFNREEEKCLGRKSPTKATGTPKESPTNLGKIVNPPSLLAKFRKNLQGEIWAEGYLQEASLGGPPFRTPSTGYEPTNSAQKFHQSPGREPRATTHLEGSQGVEAGQGGRAGHGSRGSLGPQVRGGGGLPPHAAPAVNQVPMTVCGCEVKQHYDECIGPEGGQHHLHPGVPTDDEGTSHHPGKPQGEGKAALCGRLHCAEAAEGLLGDAAAATKYACEGSVQDPVSDLAMKQAEGEGVEAKEEQEGVGGRRASQFEATTKRLSSSPTFSQFLLQLTDLQSQISSLFQTNFEIEEGEKGTHSAFHHPISREKNFQEPPRHSEKSGKENLSEEISPLEPCFKEGQLEERFLPILSTPISGGRLGVDEVSSATPGNLVLERVPKRDQVSTPCPLESNHPKADMVQQLLILGAIGVEELEESLFCNFGQEEGMPIDSLLENEENLFLKNREGCHDHQKNNPTFSDILEQGEVGHFHLNPLDEFSQGVLGKAVASQNVLGEVEPPRMF